MYTRKAYATREAPRRGRSDDQPEAREGQAGRPGVAERFVVPLKPGNSGGGKGPQFRTDAMAVGVPGPEKITSTLRLTSSAAKSARRAELPSAHRYSRLMDRPST